jgi:signal transduction histidine kinase
LVQEALTNVIRHAGASARCAVTVSVGDRSVRLSIVDDGGDDRRDQGDRGDDGDGRDDDDGRDGGGRGDDGGGDGGGDGGRSTPKPADGGHGLVGMRERTAVLGGTFDAGPRADGGWRVHAVLPMGTP